MNASLINKIKRLKGEEFISEISESIKFNDEPRFPQWFCKIPFGGQEISGTGIDFDSDIAQIKAIGEAIERYCSSKFDLSRIIAGTYNELKDKALDPAIFLNFSNNTLHGNLVQYTQKLRETEISWIDGKNQATQEKVLIPTQLVYSEYFNQDEPLIRFPLSTGAAFEYSYENAVKRGLLEIVERDAFMLTWLSRKSSPSVEMQNEKLSELQKYFSRYKLTPYVLDITSDLEIPSFLTVLIDRTGVGPAVSCGLKSDLNSQSAIIGSLLESQQGRAWVRFSYLKDKLPSIENASQINDFKTRGYFWFKKDKIEGVQFLFNYAIKLIESNAAVSNLEEITKKIFSKGYSIFTVDITYPSLKDKGLYVVKTIVPELHPLSFSNEFPYDESTRLKKMLGSKKPNLYPHPFT